MSHIEWKERRVALQNKIAAMKHFVSKCKDTVKKAAMERELQRHEQDFQRSSIMEQAAKAAEELQ